MADVFTIDDLNALAALTAADEFPVWDSEESGESTKKITAQNMTASVKALGSLVNTSEMNNALAGKQNTLTFDTTPTTGSTNPVTSGGVADAIQQSTAFSPDYVNTVDVSYTSSNQSYIAPNNGYIRINIGELTTGIQIKINNRVLFYTAPAYYGISKIGVHLIIPIAKSDDLRIIYDSTSAFKNPSLQFIPLK
jgi:hypothetical protein